jgi:4-amino-4-deoxy-L-arabinose transferase-like glycosyltransferase
MSQIDWFERGKRRHAVLVAAVFFAVTFLLGLLYPQHSDAAIHIVQAEYIWEHLELPYLQPDFERRRALVAPPLFHILLAITGGWSGVYVFVPSIMGAASVFLTYELATLWRDPETGFHSALALAVNPFFLLWSARVYIGTTITAGFLATALLYFRYLETSDRRTLYLSYLVGGGMALIKTYGSAIIIILTLHHLWRNRTAVRTGVHTVIGPLCLSGFVSLLWPIRNLVRTGSLYPEITGAPPTATGTSGIGTMIGVSVVPSLRETAFFFTQALGIMPMNLILEDVYRINAMLAYGWYLLPLTLFIVVLVGIKRSDSIHYIWIVVFLVLYFVQRILSGGDVGFKYRHFVTVTPILGFATAMVYGSWSFEWKRVVTGIVVCVLIVQMLVGASIMTAHYRTGYDPAVSWLEENTDTGEVIYSPESRYLSSKLENRVIAKSSRTGYINGHNTSRELCSKVDWVVVNDRRSRTALVQDGLDTGVLGFQHQINATREIPVGTLGRVWTIYKTTGKCQTGS